MVIFFILLWNSIAGVIYRVPTSQDKIIESLETNSGLLRDSVTLLELEIFELKGEIKILKIRLREATEALQKTQGYYDDDGNYVE